MLSVCDSGGVIKYATVDHCGFASENVFESEQDKPSKPISENTLPICVIRSCSDTYGVHPAVAFDSGECRMKMIQFWLSIVIPMDFSMV